MSARGRNPRGLVRPHDAITRLRPHAKLGFPRVAFARQLVALTFLPSTDGFDLHMLFDYFGYFYEPIQEDKEFVFFCNGAWRSALAADVAQQMGLEPVCEMDGGFTGWKKAGHPVAERPKKS